MAICKPYKRTIRMLKDGSYSNSENSQYILHPKFANEPQHYVRAFLIIQEDLKNLFQYVEPCDKNKDTISLKIHELLTRVCIEIEANLTAILKENGYHNSNNWTMKDDYCLIEISHRLSSYSVKFPIWNGELHTRTPFKKWKTRPSANWHKLNWYQAYNKSKHDRHAHFEKATLNILLDAVSALVALLSAQFMDENYLPVSKSMGIGEIYSYDYDPKFETAVGDYFRIKYPKNWLENERYDFDWQKIKSASDPIVSYNYNELKRTIH